MPIGINLQLFDSVTPRANLASIQAMWWDGEVSNSKPAGQTQAATTDANGWLTLNLLNVTQLITGESGFLTLYKKDLVSEKNSLIFSGYVVTSEITNGVDMYYYPYTFQNTSWVRPTDWLSLPNPTGLERVYALVAILPGTTPISFVAQGSYTVNWGDGASNAYDSNQKAEHLYDYSSYDPTNTTLCSRGYKQAIVQIIPNGNPANLTALDFRQTHTATGYIGATFLDLAIEAPLLTSLILGHTYSFNDNVEFPMLEQISINTGCTSLVSCLEGLAKLSNIKSFNNPSCTDLTSSFSYCYSLTSVSLTDIPAVLNMSSAFAGSSNINSIRITGTTSLTNISSAFNITSLRYIEISDALTITNASNAFNDCGFVYAPRINFRDLIDFSYAFTNNESLVAVPYYNTSNVTTVNSIFDYCRPLEFIPLWDLSKCTDFSNMFYSCKSIKTIPRYNTISAVTVASMVATCEQLSYMPLINTSNCLDFSGLFRGCPSLTEIPLLNTSKGTTFSVMFSYSGIKNIVYLNTSMGTNFDHMFNYCYNLKTVPLLDLGSAISVYGMFENSAIITLPNFNTVNVTSFYSMLKTPTLISFPVLNTSNGVVFDYMFDDTVTVLPSYVINSGSIPTSYAAKFLRSKLIHGAGLVLMYEHKPLSSTAINEILTNLQSVAPLSSTISFVGCYGYAGCTPSIGTAKGWTVTG